MAVTVSFLALPRDIRIIIYGLAGIVRQCPIDLVRECRRGAVIRSIFEREGYSSLLPDCRYGPYSGEGRTLYNELPMDFECYCDAVPLQLLTCCRTVHDEVRDLLYGRNTFKLSWWTLPARETFQHLDDTALATITALQIDLGSIDRRDQMIGTTEDINRLFEIIATKCTTSKLDFTLSCDVIERKQVGVVTQPLKRVTNLRSCAVRLTVLPDNALGKLAKRMVLGATNHVGRASGFPFMKLPKEIRYQIFEHTDLVARWRDDMADDGLVVQDGSALADSKPSYCCRRCTSSLAFCCCSHLNASFSESCVCFIFPSSFFRVSHQFATEAREVFFAQNRFIFTGQPDKTLSFLRTQSAEMLRHIRRIDFQLSAANAASWPRVDDGGLRAWRKMVTFLAENLNISNLSLSIDAGPAYDTYRHGRDIHDTTTTHVRAFYQDIIKPFQGDKRFRQLRRFHVFWALSNEHEAEAERAVKGPDYDSARQGKIPWHRRNPNFPHGVPHPTLAWGEGMES